MEARISNGLPVLIIDDVDAARFILRDMLRELGFTDFLEARSAAAALKLLAQHPVQLIFCDYIMEGMSGMDFLDKAKDLQHFRGVPVIFVSVDGNVSTVSAVIDHGATDYIVKPLSFRKLKRKVEEVLRRNESPSQPGYEINL